MAKAKPLTAKQAEQADAVAELHKLLKPGDTVYTILRHVSSSGMSRVIDLAIPIMKEKRVHVFKPSDAQLRKFGGETYIQAPADSSFEEARNREDTGAADLLSFDAKAARVRWKYGKLAGQEAEVTRDRVTVIETRKAPAIRSIGWLAARAMDDTYDRDRMPGSRSADAGWIWALPWSTTWAYHVAQGHEETPRHPQRRAGR
jgi:hypothetical protein